MNTNGRLSGKRVLVTGAGTGLGAGIAVECAREGASVAVHYGRSKAGADAVVRQIRELGGRAEAFATDLADLKEVVDLATSATEFLGGLDVLVNNAGITMNMPFDQVTPEQFDQLYNVNVRGPYFLIQASLEHLKQSQGAVINLTSIHAVQGMSEHSTYAGTKGAIVSHTRALAIELGQLGIRVNAIAPGCVPVENYSQAIGEYDTGDMGRNIPAGYVGKPEDIGKAAVFLASDDGRFMLGQTLVIDGGTTSWMPFSDHFRQSMSDMGVRFGKGYVPGL
ncbi:MAG: glucose 1-dehydrogenase [Planctomycetota bacterium]